ncbi:hypothetical protein BDN71DRAFT_1377358, partial [Pleurotus eryngii]
VFSGIIAPPDKITMSCWIWANKGLGAFHGLQKFGFKMDHVASTVATFVIVHDHL